MRISKTKTILITILSLTLLFYIGCDNEKKTGTERNLSYYAGDWYGKTSESSGEQHLITINRDGSITLNNIRSGELSVASFDITKNSDTIYTFDISNDSINVTINLDFTSDTTGEMSLLSSSPSGPMYIDITKK